MKKKKGVTLSKVGPILVAVAVCICTFIGFGTAEFLKGGIVNNPVSNAVGTPGILYRVLEIEPGWDYIYDSSTERNKIAGYLGTTADKIQFKYVSTAEFNGMNEDLVASYDLIIIGTETGTLCKDSSGKTIYNDKSLDGYIYLAFGDLVKYDDRMAGMLPYDYYPEAVDKYINGVTENRYTYKISGVSFSKDQYSNAITTNWKGQNTIYNMNNNKVWSPGMRNYFAGEYYLLQSINDKSWSNVDAYYGDKLGNTRFSGNDITEKKMNELLDYVRTGRPVVLADNLYNCVSGGNKAAYPTSNVYSFLSNVQGKSNIVKYSTMNTTLAGSMHNAVLNITAHSIMYQNSSDQWVNAPNISYTNGLVSSSSIIVGVDQFRYTVDFDAVIGKEYYIKLIVDKNTDGRFNSVASVDDFNEVYYVAIEKAETATMHHTLDINLPVNYNGMFGWQILVEELDSARNPIDRVSVEGHTVVKGDTKHVKVLQLLPGNDGRLHMKNHDTFKNQMNNAASKIGYSVTVDTMNVGEFEQKFVGNPYTKGTSYKTAQDYLNFNGYNMLVIGFVDSYNKEDISDDYGALSCVLDFIENGNSVLFSHDTMQFQPSANMGIKHAGVTTDTTNRTYTLRIDKTNGFGERAGYIMTLGMRKLVGMDRYSATTIPSFTNESILETYGIPKKADGTYITELQGFSNWFLLWMNRCTTYRTTRTSSGLYTLVPNTKLVNDSIGGLNDNTKTWSVDEINEGQITMYPYDVTSSGKLTVAETHSQYYQIDLNDDDIVVWYTLGDTDGTDKGDYYGSTYKDAANNYYIYSKGNITYTGAGHQSISGEAEVRLFVNTVIRAASAGNFVPTVKSVNGAITPFADTYVVFPKPYDTSYLVQFTAYDEDLATKEVIKHSYPESQWNEHIGRFSAGAIYWIDDLTGTERVLKNYNRTNPEAYLLNGEITDFVIYNPLDQGKTMAEINASVYLKNMYDCYMRYNDKGGVDLRIDATDYYGETGSCIIQVTNQELFNLD